MKVAGGFIPRLKEEGDVDQNYRNLFIFFRLEMGMRGLFSSILDVFEQRPPFQKRLQEEGTGEAHQLKPYLLRLFFKRNA